MATTPPGQTPRKAGGVFFRVRTGTQEAIIVRPMNAKAGQKFIKVDRITQAETLEIIRAWRRQTGSLPIKPGPVRAHQQIAITAGKKKTITANNIFDPLSNCIAKVGHLAKLMSDIVPAGSFILKITHERHYSSASHLRRNLPEPSLRHARRRGPQRRHI
ncbi:MAG TPA: hypothetical protein VNU92_04965 [Edaphobacter sp.]|nr:hypothetical protein [Edaphobacter sp.]